MNEIERMQRLIRLANNWFADSQMQQSFMPDPEGDKIARARTEACARELLRVLAGEETRCRQLVQSGGPL